MAERPLHIAWLGPGPVEGAGVPGVAFELLWGLAELGHRIDTFFPSAGERLPERLESHPNVTVTRGTNTWRWERWYSRTRLMAFVSGMLTASVAMLRLRHEIERAHRGDPYDVIYQFSTIESLAVPGALTRTVPLVIHPETHSAGELRSLLAERELSLRCGSRARFATAAAIMLARSLVQRVRIRRARLLVCISSVFRDHMVRDYGFPHEHTVVVPNPVRRERFPAIEKPLGDPPVVLVLGRVAARKGVESVVALAHTLRARGVRAQIRIVGGPSLWSDYTPLLEGLPHETALYVGALPGDEIPRELASADVLLQASSYEPFALTVAEALSSGVPVVGTSQVGAIERVSRSVAVEVAPKDVEAMADGIVELLSRVRAEPAQMREAAHAEAQRLFAPEVVCGQVAAALGRIVGPAGRNGESRSARPASGAT
jgi:glycosyltransferase involved in cell wall biosynthesis